VKVSSLSKVTQGMPYLTQKDTSIITRYAKYCFRGDITTCLRVKITRDRE